MTPGRDRPEVRALLRSRAAPAAAQGMVIRGRRSSDPGAASWLSCLPLKHGACRQDIPRLPAWRPRSVDRRSLLAGLSAGLRIRALERRADPLQGAVEVIVCRVQVIQDALKRRLGLHVVANGEKEPMG